MPTWNGKTLGNVVIGEMIARGGMAEVYNGMHTTLKRNVAVKIMRDHVEEDPDSRARFDREARVVAGLDHPNVIKIFDYTLVDGRPCLIMELVPGNSLGNYMKALQKRGYEIWYDEYSLKLGDSLTAEIDKGLIECDYGVVILSKSFFSKKWAQKELAGLVARETSPTTGKTIILPVWHDINAEEIKQYSPTLADRIAVSTNGGLKKVVDEIVKVVGGQEKKLNLQIT